MKIAEIERELKAAGVDPRLRYWIANLQEQIIAQGQAIDEMTQLVIQVTTNVANLTELSHEHNALLNKIKNRGGNSGLVESVLPDPEDQ